jgi:hypothetical protein
MALHADISVEQGKVSVSCKQEARGEGRQACARFCGCKGDKLVRLQEKQKCTCIAEVVMATEPAASNAVTGPREQSIIDLVIRHATSSTRACVCKSVHADISTPSS